MKNVTNTAVTSTQSALTTASNSVKPMLATTGDIAQNTVFFTGAAIAEYVPQGVKDAVLRVFASFGIVVDPTTDYLLQLTLLMSQPMGELKSPVRLTIWCNI